MTPQVPQENEPIIVTLKLNNPSTQPLITNYQFYADGKLILEETANIPSASHVTRQYAYRNTVQIGEQMNFVLRSNSELGTHERVLSSPPYPPQVWSSFVSFATFSTTVMSSMVTMTHYEDSFGNDTGVNLGLIITLVAVALLIFLELTPRHANTQGRTSTSLGRLRVRLPALTWILLIIFMGIMFTRIVLIITT